MSRRSAEVSCRQIQADLTTDIARGSAPRLSEWCERYKRIRTDLSADTLKIVDHTCRYLLAFFKDDPSIDRIQRVEASEWRSALARGELASANVYPKPDELADRDTRSRKYRAKIEANKPLAESTVAKHVRAAKRMFREAGPDCLNLIRIDPLRHLSGTSPEIDKAWHTVTAAAMQKILDQCPSQEWKAIFALCRHAGLRRGEALRLQWCDVLWNENKLLVNARVKKGTKKRGRVIPIEPKRLPTGLTAILRDAFEAAPDGSVYVCAGISVATIDQHARKIIAAAGNLYADPFHALRRNREAELASKYPMHVFAEWQGHSPEVAAKYYLRVEESLYDPPKLAKRLAKTKRKPVARST